AAFDAQKVTDWQPGMPLEEIEYRPHQSPRSVQPGHPQAHAQADATEDYPTYALPIVNHSPGGYCLSWPKEVPACSWAG
ncbi:molecular chaperone, partial [Pseudomonas aeruginosa]